MRSGFFIAHAKRRSTSLDPLWLKSPSNGATSFTLRINRSKEQPSMSRVVILGATGSLGRHVLQQAMVANHDVSVIVRTPSKLPADVRAQVTVHQCDLSAASISDLTSMLSGQDVVINTAGLVTEGQAFVALIDRLV